MVLNFISYQNIIDKIKPKELNDGYIQIISDVDPDGLTLFKGNINTKFLYIAFNYSYLLLPYIIYKSSFEN
jgi:hypothetical protein